MNFLGLYSHLLHALLKPLKWDIEHTRDMEKGDYIHTSWLTFHAYEVRNLTFQVTDA